MLTVQTEPTENVTIRWYMSKEVSDKMGRPLWLYIQKQSSLWGANVIFTAIENDDMCDQLIEIGKLMEERKRNKL